MDSTLTKILVIAAGIGASATFLLFLLRKSKEEEYLIDTVRTSRQKQIKMVIPKASIGTVIGRQGCTIKRLQAETNTKINFNDDEEDTHRTLVIRGLSKDVVEAERLVQSIIDNQPIIETYDMFVPQKACGVIIGRNGDNIRSICQASQAKVEVERAPFHHESDAPRRVTIRGTDSQILLAKSLIEEKILEAESRQRHSDKAFSKKDDSPCLLAITSNAEETQPYKTELCQLENLIPMAGDGFAEIFVSAVASPDSFWVQVVGTRATELDKMVEELTDLYSQESYRASMTLEEVKVGDIVVAPFSHDDSWYRARVECVEEESYSPEEKKLTLYYVDFGDSAELTMQEVYKVDKKYLGLPFQAIECKLADVRPVEGQWTEEAIQTFENLTKVAQWKVIMACPVDPSGENVTCVRLIDTLGPEDVNIAEELISRGFAARKNQET